MTQISKTMSRITIGLDLGGRKSRIAVLDKSTGEVLESVVETKQSPLKAFFGRYRGATVVFEVGAQSRWVQALLRQLGLNVITANPRQLALITKSHKKTDKRDALVLARLGSGMPELLETVEHRSPRTHANLAIIKSRELLVATRTRLVNRIRALVKSVGEPLEGCDATYFFRKARAKIPGELRPACEPLLEILEDLHAKIRAFDKEIETIAERYPAVNAVRQVDRIGTLTGLSFVLTVENPHRFRDIRRIGSYVGLVPKLDDSGDRVTQLGISKAGDKMLRRLLVLCANQILSSRGRDCHLRRWGLKLCERGGKNAKKRATVAVARKLAVLLLALWRNGSEYEPMRNVAPEQQAA